ncbi:MAG: hypothetical protein HYY25_01800, partial [Candidatus Wallbacteria bacterium]|nr:hypothetical protein [Candidatus Wallbacteria bacterium]
PLASTPTIGLAAPGATNDVSSAELERTADPLVWFYDAAIEVGTGNDGLATVAVGNALDAAGNANGPPSNATFTIDVTGPTVLLSFSRAAGPIGVGPLTITATFGEPLDTTPTLAIQAPGSANDLDTTLLTATADPKVWTLAIAILSGTDTDGAATVTVAGVDIAGNPSQPAGSSGFEIDATAPAADLTYSRDPATVTAGQLRITATFDEAMTTAPTLAIAAPGTENDVSATEMTPTGDPKVWVFVATIVKGTGNDGDAFVTIAGGTDAAGNPNRPATHGSITLKTSIPGVELAYSRNPAAVGLGTLAITATFTEPILTVPNLSIAAPGSVNDATGVAMTATADARRWVHVATIAPGEGADGPALVSISNGRGEGGLENSPALNAAFTIDATAPTVALTTSKPAEAVGPGAFTITAAFSEPLAAPPTLAISAPGSANDAVSAMSPTGDAKVWTYLAMIVAGSANDGQATVALTATDAAGNLAADAPNSSFTIDTTGPAVTLSYSKNPLAVGPGSLAITAAFDEALVSWPTLAIAAPGSANDVTATAMSPTADGRVWTHVATIAPGDQGDGLALVTIAGATDFAGNQNQPASQATFTIGATPPSVTMTYSQNSAAVRPGPLGLTATFSAPLATTPTIAIEAPGSASDLTATAMTSTADARVWTLTATLASGGGADGLAVVAIANGRTQAGVENLAAENATFTIDGTPPAVALTYSKPVTAVGPGALAITATFSEAVTTTPTIAVAAQGTANDFFATALTGTDDPKVWTFSAVIAAAAGSDGLAIVAIAGGSDLAGNENQPASNAELTLDVTRPQVSLTYSQSVSAVTSGELAITASFSEPIASTPTLLVDAPGSSNDVPGAAMTSTGNPRVWSHSTLIRQRSGLEGLATASIVNGKDAAGNENLPAVGGRFFVAPETSPLTPNQPPVARIRPQTLAGGPRLLSMDGLSSTDPEGGALTFAWTLEERPAGAAGFASDRATIEYPARLPGSYRFNLSVFDSGLLAGSQSTTFTVANVAPVAVVRELADIVLGRDARTTVRLDASGSFDDNGSPLTYRWTIEQAPDRAAGQSAPTTLAALSNDTSAQTELSFANTARSGTGSSLLAAGAYVVRLTVSDGVETSSVTQRIRAIDPLFLLPVADAGPDRSIRVTFKTDGSPEPTIPGLLPSAGSSPVSTDRVTLDGRESCDPAKRSITYTWSVRTAPAGSAVTALSNGNSAFPSFKPDRAGRYRFRLTVSNGLAASAPDEVDVLIRSGNEPPVALPRSEDLARVRRSSLANPVLAFNVGDRIVLDASDSSDPDPADRGQLRYQWTQTEGSRTSLEPVSTAPVVSFAPVGIGRASFELTVTDPQGETDSRPVGVVVLPAGTQVTDGGVPLVSVVASASTTTATGGDFPPEGISLARPRSLRVAIASSPPSLVVTLSASVTRTATTVDRLDFVWRQVAGPTVVLTNPGESRTASRTSVTSFAPTTSRIHEFELSVFPLDPVGSRTELVARRRIRVVVDSPDSTVPEAAGSVTPAALTSGVTTAERTITLDATSSRLVGVLAQRGRKLAYNWRQLAGPEGQFENPFSARTRFVAPLPRSTGPETFLFELTVDVTPPGDRSEPIYFAVEQASSSGSSVPGSSAGSLSGGGGGGGGCGLARASGGAGPGWLDLLWYLLPLAYLRRPRPVLR